MSLGELLNTLKTNIQKYIDKNIPKKALVINQNYLG